MLGGIGPRIAIMEVEQEVETCLLDTTSQALDIGQILHDLRTAAITDVLLTTGWVDKEAHTHGIETLRLQEGKDVGNSRTVSLLILGTLQLVGRQHRDVYTHHTGVEQQRVYPTAIRRCILARGWGWSRIRVLALILVPILILVLILALIGGFILYWFVIIATSCDDRRKQECTQQQEG